MDTLATNQICSISSRHAKGLRNIAAKVSPESTMKSPTARAGLDQAASVMGGTREVAAPAYSFRRAAHTHHDDSGVIAAVREHSSANSTCIPIVVSFGRTLGERGLAVNAGHSTNKTVNYGNSQAASTHLVSLIKIESW
jgi:hypothetical protein